MEQKKSPWGKIRLVYRRSSTLLKCVVLAAIVLFTAAMLILRGSIRQTRLETEQKRAQAATLEQENKDLEKNIAELGTIQSIKRIAREKLGLDDPDTKYYDIED